MLSIYMILTAVVLLSTSGLIACLLSANSKLGQKITVFFMFIGSIVGLGGVWSSFNAAANTLSLSWFLPFGKFAVSIDAISAVFLIPVFVVPLLGSIYSLGYWKQSKHKENGRKLGLFYGLLAGSMALVVVARDGVLFIAAWEIMAMSAYFAAAVEDENTEVRHSGWIYLIATHTGTLCLIAMFALWNVTANSFALQPVVNISSDMAGAIFVLALIGFGFKAGIMPLHIWLPGAHANAPSHISAVMSGVMLKMGIYGIVRMVSLLGTIPIWWGSTLLVLGVITGIAGIAYAIAQHDLKRLLAYSSIENIGIIVIGLGLALIGRSLNQIDWIMLGLGGCILHIWNHSLFKSLMFFNAGAIIHTAHTRQIDSLGGLAKVMPKVFILSVIGAAAICGLPPLNGFASEWLIYNGLFSTIGIGGSNGFPAASIAAVALAMIGALSLLCFVKLIGMVFLGSNRSKITQKATDPSASMIFPMVIAALACICIGLFPMIAVKILDKAVASWASIPITSVSIISIIPLGWITKLGLALAGLIVFFTVILKIMPNCSVIGKAGTWDCGYAKPTTRIQYTGSSFAQMIVNLFGFVLWPKIHNPDISEIFPKLRYFKSIIPDVVLDRLIMPIFNIAGRYLPMLRIFQQGQTHLYVLYVLLIVIVLVIWGTIGV